MQKGICCPDSKCLSVHIKANGYSKPCRVIGGARRQRYQCLNCKKNFSSNALSIGYRCKILDPALNAKIFSHHVHGLSNRGIARLSNVSEHCIRIRLFKMSQFAFDFHLFKTKDLSISETLCMDGLENFSGSQYDPNYINFCIGRDSLFTYNFNFSPLNRKGRMSVWQKGVLKSKTQTEGRYNSKSIRLATSTLLRRLAMKSQFRLSIISDEHFQYKHAIQKELRDLKIEHLTISSKVCRNFQNILFAVNHSDLLIRQRIAAFSRETISFSKTPARMCQRYMLFVLHKNFMLPQFTKKHVRRIKSHLQSPAQALGIEEHLLKFNEIFSITNKKKILESNIIHNREWEHFRNNQIPSEFLRSRQHCYPKYAA